MKVGEAPESTDDDGEAPTEDSTGGGAALLVNGDTEKLDLKMLISSEDTFLVTLATDPGAGTQAVDITLGTGKNGNPAHEFFGVDKSELIFTGGPDGDWDTPQPVKVTTTSKHGWKDHPVTIKVTENGDDSNSINIVVWHIHEEDIDSPATGDAEEAERLAEEAARLEAERLAEEAAAELAAEEAERLAEEDDTPVPFATPEVNVDDLVGAAIAVPSDNNKSIAALLGAVAAFLFLLPFRKKEELPLFTCINLLDPQGP